MNQGTSSNSFCVRCTINGFTCDRCIPSHALYVSEVSQSDNDVPDLIDSPRSEYMIRNNNYINNNTNNIYNNIEEYDNIIQNEYNNNISPLYYIYDIMRQLSYESITNIKLKSRLSELTEETFECSICLDDHRHSCGLTLECGHKFCANSICMNLKKSDKCPLCRLKIKSLSLTRDVVVESIDIRIDLMTNQQQQQQQQDVCINCTEKSHCQISCGHLFCGNCIVSHLHSNEKLECPQCNSVISEIKL
jgi:hypothetical protein